MSRYRRIVLHAGLSKTGSTSIQATCARQGDRLRAHGIDYPLFARGQERFDNHSLPLTLAQVAAPERLILGLRQRYGDALPGLVRDSRDWLQGVLQRGGDTLLLSTELLENYAPADLRALRDRLAEHCDELRVVACIRSPRDSLESLLQERLKAGAVLEPADIVGRVRRKYENLLEGFGDRLLVRNYHALRRDDLGLVGAFLAEVGAAPALAADLEPVVDNPRMSLPCYRMMRAINLALPKQRADEHGVARSPQDLNALLRLPGAPFHLNGLVDRDVEAGLDAETAWLAAALGFTFPPHRWREPAEPWSADTLAALPGVLEALAPAPLRRCATQFLVDEAATLAASRPDTAARLHCIAAAQAAD